MNNVTKFCDGFIYELSKLLSNFNGQTGFYYVLLNIKSIIIHFKL